MVSAAVDIGKWKCSSLSCIWLCNFMDCSPPGSFVHGILQQEYWSDLPFPSPGDLPEPGIKSGSPILQVDSLPSEPSENPVGCSDLWQFSDQAGDRENKQYHHTLHSLQKCLPGTQGVQGTHYSFLCRLDYSSLLGILALGIWDPGNLQKSTRNSWGVGNEAGNLCSS